MMTERMPDHCETCGRDLGAWDDVSDGYTTCCNELPCSGRPARTWQVGTTIEPRAVVGTIRACCAARATAPAGLIALSRIG